MSELLARIDALTQRHCWLCGAAADESRLCADECPGTSAQTDGMGVVWSIDYVSPTLRGSAPMSPDTITAASAYLLYRYSDMAAVTPRSYANLDPRMGETWSPISREQRQRAIDSAAAYIGTRYGEVDWTIDAVDERSRRAGE